MPNDITTYILASKWIINSWIIYLNIRQMRLVNQMDVVPEYVRDVYPEQQLNLAKAYQFEKILLTIIYRFYDIFVFSAQIASGVIPKLWTAASALGGGDFSKTFIFTLFSLAIESCVYMPLKMFNIFVIEQHYGFNRQDVSTFMGDAIREVIVKTIISTPMLWLSISVIKWRPDSFQYYLMFITLAFRVVMVVLYLDFLFPMLATFKPLPEGPLKNKIQELASSVGFPLYDIYIMETSTRTTHGNAFFIGLNKRKMIVFFDTMLEGHVEGNMGWFRKKRYSEKELLGILGHEMGHWKYGHIAKGLALYQVVTCLEILMCSMFVYYEPAYLAVGFSSMPPPYVGLVIFSELLLLPYELLVHYVSVAANRQFEVEADEFSVSLGQREGLISGLKKITAESLRLPKSDPYYSAWYDTHPTLEVRLQKIMELPESMSRPSGSSSNT